MTAHAFTRPTLAAVVLLETPWTLAAPLALLLGRLVARARVALVAGTVLAADAKVRVA